MAGEPTISLTGRVGNDPEVRFTQTGRAVCNFSVAVTPRSKGDDGWKDLETTWFRVSVWGKPGESFMEVGRKGDLVTLAGRFSTRTYEAKDGTNRTDLTVDADSVGIVPIVKSDSSWGSPIDQTQEAPF